jgi:hypothetical protein
VAEDRFELRAPAVICDELDGEVVAIDLESGRYYRMTGASSAVWGGLVAGASPGEVAAACAEPGAGASVGAFADRLLDLGLLRPAPAAASPGALPPWAPGGLEVEEFSDLEDILGLDPIHEVDQDEGWTLAGPG